MTYSMKLPEFIRKPQKPRVLENRSDSSPKKPWVGIIVYDERQFYAKIFPRENSDLVDASIIESKQSLGAGFVGKRVSGIHSKDVLPLPDRSVMVSFTLQELIALNLPVTRSPALLTLPNPYRYNSISTIITIYRRR